MTEIAQSPYQRILFCTDFSHNADFAFDFAIDAAARRPGCVLHLLHVLNEPDAQFWKTYIYEVDDIDQKAREDIDRKIADTYLPRVPEDIEFMVDFRIGRDYIEILKFAEEHKVDLIVIGRQGHSTLGSMLFGTVTEKVARNTHCPVLVVPLEHEKNVEMTATK
ncbi:MAG: universal stress protein [Lentisphaeria bacterium]|nr:universal stress protein [Lentisphaeria bacterium]